MNPKLVVIILFCFLPYLLSAQPGKLQGTVKDKETGDPLHGATVMIEKLDLKTVTDLDGKYFFLAIPSGLFFVQVDYICYQNTTIAHFLSQSNLTTTLYFKLSSTIVRIFLSFRNRFHFFDVNLI